MSLSSEINGNTVPRDFLCFRDRVLRTTEAGHDGSFEIMGISTESA
jgi:hypothetical protein